jgi:hypothetical protein
MARNGLTVAEEMSRTFFDDLEDAGITSKYLIQKLKTEMDAKIKDNPLWIVRQKARQDAHKLRGDYPKENGKLQVEGELTIKWEE